MKNLWSGGKYKYKVVLNNNSVEIYNYEKERNYKVKEDGNPFDPKSREPDGQKRVGKSGVLKQSVDKETGEIKKRLIQDNATLEEKLEYGIYTQEEYEERKYKSLNDSKARAITECRRKLDNNLFMWGEKPKFVTLTYRKNQLDREEALKDFRNFIKRFNYNVKNPKLSKAENLKQWLRWLAVIEHQTKRGKKNNDEGALHFHVVFFNLPYIHYENLNKLWKHGATDIREIKLIEGEKTIRKITGYMLKYIMKEQTLNVDETLKTGKLTSEKKKRFYLSSRGLLKEREILFKENEKHLIDEILKDNDFEKLYETEFNNKYTGNTVYEQYFKSL